MGRGSLSRRKKAGDKWRSLVRHAPIQRILLGKENVYEWNTSHLSIYLSMSLHNCMKVIISGVFNVILSIHFNLHHSHLSLSHYYYYSCQPSSISPALCRPVSISLILTNFLSVKDSPFLKVSLCLLSATGFNSHYERVINKACKRGLPVTIHYLYVCRMYLVCLMHIKTYM